SACISMRPMPISSGKAVCACANPQAISSRRHRRKRLLPMSEVAISGLVATSARTAADEARRREERLAWKLAAPAIILTVLLILLPTAAVIFWSLTNFELGYDGFEFIGLENYAELFSDRTFLISLKNTAIYTAIVAP